MLVVKNLTKKYGDFTAVNGISYDVRTGATFGILGRTAREDHDPGDDGGFETRD